MGGRPHPFRGRFLHGRRRHHRVPERTGHCRRLHVGGLLPRHFRGRHDGRLRWPHLRPGLHGRLAHSHFPAGRTPAQSRQIHLCRRGRLPLPAKAHPAVRRLRHAGHHCLLPDCTDGRGRPAHQAAVRARLLDGGGHRRRADDGLRTVRWHDGHHLGADHQGRAAAVWREFHGLHGDETLRFQLRGAVCRCRARQGARGRTGGRQSRRSRKGRTGADGPRRLHQGSHFRHRLRHGTDVRYRRPAAHPDALLHRAGREGGPQIGVLGHHLDRLFLPADLRHRLWRHHTGAHQSGIRQHHHRHHPRRGRHHQHGGRTGGEIGGWQPVLRVHLGRGLCHHPGRGGRPDTLGRLGRLA